MCPATPMDGGTTTTDAGGGGGGGTRRFGETCQNRTDCASGLLCVGGSGVTPFCTRVCTDDCTCPRGYGCAARLSTGQTVCVPGNNGCVTEPADAGTAAPDVVVARDVVAPRDLPVSSDVVAAQDVQSGPDVPVTANDVVFASTDGGKAASELGDLQYINPNRGCGCRAASPRGSQGALLGALLAIATLRRRRRN